MKEQIGETAGKLWSAIGEKQSILLDNLPKIADGNKTIANLALGWLAREDKVKFERKGKVVSVSLTEREAETFKKTRR